MLFIKTQFIVFVISLVVEAFKPLTYKKRGFWQHKYCIEGFNGRILACVAYGTGEPIKNIKGQSYINKIKKALGWQHQIYKGEKNDLGWLPVIQSLSLLADVQAGAKGGNTRFPIKATNMLISERR